MKRNGLQCPSVFIVLLMIFTIFAASCKKNNDAGASTQTVRQYISNAPQYTLFYKALQRASLDTLLGGAIPYTVFAVGDSDMIKSGYTSAGIDTVDVQRLRRTLLYQMIPGTIDKSSLQFYQETPLITADSNIQAYLELNNFGLFYNGIPVVGLDSGMSNGVIQRLQTMATPPIGDLFATIASISSLSDYNFEIHVVGQYGSAGDYLKTPSPASPYTVFLPNNAAFAALGLDNIAAIQRLMGGTINNYFWGNGQYYTNDFIGGSKLFLNTGTNYLTNYLWFTKDGYSFYPTNYFDNSVNPYLRYVIVQANIVATNGVIHIIQPYTN